MKEIIEKILKKIGLSLGDLETMSQVAGVASAGFALVGLIMDHQRNTRDAAWQRNVLSKLNELGIQLDNIQKSIDILFDEVPEMISRELTKLLTDRLRVYINQYVQEMRAIKAFNTRINQGTVTQPEIDRRVSQLRGWAWDKQEELDGTIQLITLRTDGGGLGLSNLLAVAVGAYHDTAILAHRDIDTMKIKFEGYLRYFRSDDPIIPDVVKTLQKEKADMEAGFRHFFNEARGHFENKWYLVASKLIRKWPGERGGGGGNDPIPIMKFTIGFVYLRIKRIDYKGWHQFVPDRIRISSYTRTYDSVFVPNGGYLDHRGAVGGVPAIIKDAEWADARFIGQNRFIERTLYNNAGPTTDLNKLVLEIKRKVGNMAWNVINNRQADDSDYWNYLSYKDTAKLMSAIADRRPTFTKIYNDKIHKTEQVITKIERWIDNPYLDAPDDIISPANNRALLSFLATKDEKTVDFKEAVLTEAELLSALPTETTQESEQQEHDDDNNDSAVSHESYSSPLGTGTERIRKRSTDANDGESRKHRRITNQPENASDDVDTSRHTPGSSPTG